MFKIPGYGYVLHWDYWGDVLPRCIDPCYISRYFLFVPITSTFLAAFPFSLACQVNLHSGKFCTSATQPSAPRDSFCREVQSFPFSTFAFACTQGNDLFVKPNCFASRYLLLVKTWFMSHRVIHREKTYLLEVKLYFEARLQWQQHRLKHAHLLQHLASDRNPLALLRMIF